MNFATALLRKERWLRGDRAISALLPLSADTRGLSVAFVGSISAPARQINNPGSFNNSCRSLPCIAERTIACEPPSHPFSLSIRRVPRLLFRPPHYDSSFQGLSPSSCFSSVNGTCLSILLHPHPAFTFHFPILYHSFYFFLIFFWRRWSTRRVLREKG